MSGYPTEKTGQLGYEQNFQQGYNDGQYPQTQQGQGSLSPPPPMMMNTGAASGYPGASSGVTTQFLDPNIPRPNDILPLHPAIIQQRQIAASLPPCPQGGYHELRRQHALGMNAGTLASVICFPIVCCCVRDETVCLKCKEKFDINLPRIN